MKEELFGFIDKFNSDYVKMADSIFDNPELGLEEYYASNILTDVLADNGFVVEKGIAGLPTAFRASYGDTNAQIAIGLLCEYDALAGLGHACGHHLQGPAILLTAMALKETFANNDLKIVVYGTPAEETSGGKIQMVKQGCFLDIDIALMMHGSPTTTTDVRSLALSNFTVNFYGTSAHAAVKPEDGRSALDGLILLLQGIEFLREHVRDDVRIHYAITDGGGVANIVPKFAAAKISLRSYDRVYLDTVVARFRKIVQGAALMSETEFELVLEKAYDSKIPVLSLNNLLMENAKLVNAPNIKPPREKTGSTDFGNVMYIVPGSCIRVAFVPEGTSSHSDIYVDMGKSVAAHDAIIYAAKILAATAYDIITDKDLMKTIKEEFNANKQTK